MKREEKEVLACELCNNNCQNCYNSEYCGYWNDTDPNDIPTVWVKEN